MNKLITTEKTIFSPEEITYGVRVGEYKGNSTITEVFIKSDSLEEEEINFRILGSIERAGLVMIFEDLARILKKDIK